MGLFQSEWSRGRRRRRSSTTLAVAVATIVFLQQFCVAAAHVSGGADTEMLVYPAELRTAVSPCASHSKSSNRISSCLSTGSHPASKSHHDVASVHCCSGSQTSELACSARSEWGEVSYNQAVSACAGTGDRLCTADELHSKECSTQHSCSKASSQHMLSWTSDVCADNSGHDRTSSVSLKQVDIPLFAAAADGCNSRGDQIVESVCLETASQDMLAGVRCCSGPVREATMCQSYCQELTPTIWANLNIQDPNVTTYEIADSICRSVNQRLCEPIELVARDRLGNGTMLESVCCLTGCAGDDMVVWTSQVCGPSLTGQQGEGGEQDGGLANLVVLGVPWWVFLIAAAAALLLCIVIALTIYTVKKRKKKRKYYEEAGPTNPALQQTI